MLKLLYLYFLVKKSKLFDQKYYLSMYPDVRKADINPIWHFINEGWREYRNPSGVFNTRFYLASNPDVNHSGVNPLIHYIKYGKKEGRITIPQKSFEDTLGYEIGDDNIKQTFKSNQKERNLPIHRPSKSLTVFLHVGDTKTGTSIIQNFLDMNRFNLYSNHNCLYPNLDSKHMEAGRFHNHGLWYKSIKGKTKQFTDDFNRILKFSKTNHMNKVILSFEEWLLEQEFMEFFEQTYTKHNSYDLKIICYVRRIDFWCQSAWKQWGLKKSKNLEDFIEKPRIGDRFKFIKEKLDQWADIVGNENIIVRPYEKQQLKYGIIDDFLTSVCVDRKSTDWETTESKNIAMNAGFNHEVLEILHLCQGLFSDVHDNHLFDLFSTLLGDEYMKPPFESYSLLSPQIGYELYQNNLRYEKAIAEKYMNSGNGKIFQDPIPDPNETWQQRKTITLEQTIPILIKLIEGNNQLINEIRKKLDEERLFSES